MICQLFCLSDKLVLPIEILLDILHYCESKDLANIARVSKDFSVLASDEKLWNSIFNKKYPHVDDKKVQLKLDSMCCWKHKFIYMEKRSKFYQLVQAETQKTSGEVKKGDIVIMHGKCCKIVQVSQMRSGKH